MRKQRQQTPTEELANAITHGTGLLLAVAALVILIIFANSKGDIWHLIGMTVFGTTLIILYLSSTIYHSFPEGKWKKTLRVVDHASIFLLIAGTYTPVTLTAMRGPWGWTIFGIVWGIALLGILLKILFINKLKDVSLILYIAMGWLIVIAVRPLIDSVERISLIYLIAGGLFYTLGTIFYAWKSLPYGHAIWHLFVMGGSISHFFAVFYLLPS